MNIENVANWMKWPALIVGFALALKLIIGTFGWELQSSDIKIAEHLDQHIEQTTPKIEEMSKLINVLTDGVDAALTGECLENSFEALVRQRLVNKCKELGVDRTLYRTPNQAQSAPLPPPDTLQ